MATVVPAQICERQVLQRLYARDGVNGNRVFRLERKNLPLADLSGNC